MSIIIGILLNGLLPILVITWIIDLFLFKNMDPNKRALLTTATAVTIVVFLSAFIVLDMREYAMLLLFYIPGAILAFLWRRRGYRKKWDRDAQLADEIE